MAGHWSWGSHRARVEFDPEICGSKAQANRVNMPMTQTCEAPKLPKMLVSHPKLPQLIMEYMPTMWKNDEAWWNTITILWILHDFTMKSSELSFPWFLEDHLFSLYLTTDFPPYFWDLSSPNSSPSRRATSSSRWISVNDRKARPAQRCQCQNGWIGWWFKGGEVEKLDRVLRVNL